MLTLHFLQDRVDISLKGDFSNWTVYLLLLLVALLCGEWLANKMLKRSNA